MSEHRPTRSSSQDDGVLPFARPGSPEVAQAASSAKAQRVADDGAGEVMSYDAMHRAMGVIIERCHPDLVVWAGSLADPADAEDIVQDALLRYWLRWQRRPERPDPIVVRAALFTQVHDIARARQRRSGRRRRGVMRIAGAVSAERALHISSPFISGIRNWMWPERSVEAIEIDPLLRKALKDITPTQRELISLVFAHGQTYDEAGTALRLKPGSVRAHLSRASKRLLHSLQRLGYTRPGRALKSAGTPPNDPDHYVADSPAEEG